MNYMGGKHRQGKKIAAMIQRVLREDQWYVEPFCGALGVAHRVAHPKMVLADISEPLINMWVALKNPDLELPDVITEEEYKAVKAVRDPRDWRTAYYGFGMSFGGKYWGGYKRITDQRRNYARELKESVRSRMIPINNACFILGDYSDLSFVEDAVVYCDPPYAGRTKPHNCPEFDHNKFWEWCRMMVAKGNTVLATEFTVPPDFVILHDFGDTVVRHHNGLPPDGTREVLVCHGSQVELFGVV